MRRFAQTVGMNRKIPALFALTLVLSFALAIIVNSYMPQNSKAVADTQKCVYLTFDDGPSDKVTPAILDILKEENVPATFFIVGVNAEKRPELLKRAVREGHTLGVHSYSHKYKEIYASVDALIKDIEACNEIIKGVTGKYSKIYRFPGGSFTIAPELKAAVTAKGYEYVDWNASFRDCELTLATEDDLYNAAVSTVAYPDRVVMLAHDGAGKTSTCGALKKVIKYFKDKNYVFKAF